MGAKKSNAQEISIDFMMEEYTQLNGYVQNTRILRDGRLNFFLAAISGMFVGLGLINQSQANSETTNFMSAGIVLGILVIGLVNFHNMMKNNFDIAKCQRGLNRIKRYFIEHNKDIESYLIFPANDDIPRFKARFPILTAVINGVLAGIGVPLLASSIFVISLTWLYILGVIVFALTLFSLDRYFIARARKEESLFQVQFPSEIK